MAAKMGKRSARETRRAAALVIGLVSVVLLASCGDENQPATEAEEPSFDDVELAGTPILGALARTAGERFALNTDIDVQVEPATSETALDAVCTGEIAVAMTERPATDAELAGCDGEGVELVELTAGHHAVAVAASRQLEIDCLTAANLRQLWSEDSPAQAYSELRPALPGAAVNLYGPDEGSLSLALFTDAILGSGTIRDDYEPVADWRVFITRLMENDDASGFFNFAEIDAAAPENLRLVAVADDDGCVAPSFQSVQSGRYDLLSQPLYMYASRAALAEPPVSRYMQFLFENYQQTAKTTTTLVPLAPGQVQQALAKLPELPPAPE